MTKKTSTRKSIANKRARYDYDLQEEIVAGVVLTGAETKSLRLGQGTLMGSFAQLKGGELWLSNFQVNPLITNRKDLPESERTRPRKLLVTKKQLLQLQAAKQQGLNIIPIKLLSEGKYIKVVLGIGRGRKKYDKRQLIRKRDETRAIAREYR